MTLSESTFETSVSVERVSALLFRAMAKRPLVTSFGSLHDRPALFVEVADTDGARGWGEVWCNFPAFAAEHRASFLQKVIAPMFEGTLVSEPSEVARRIDRALGVQAIQAGEEGLVSSLAAGLDQAVWDLVARRHGLPLWRLLGGNNEVRVYASNIDPDQALETIDRARQDGHRAFKLKVGFGDRVDLAALARIREALGEGVSLMIDANQAWTTRQALEFANRAEAYNVLWLEEPIRADEPMRNWRELSGRSPIPLAAGENIRNEHGFRALIDGQLVSQVQPDAGKWGGVSGCLRVGRRAVSERIGYSPHWLAGGIGLAHSFNLLGATGGVGFAEVDANPNALREGFPLPIVSAGIVELTNEPGFGFEPDFTTFKTWRRDIP